MTKAYVGPYVITDLTRFSKGDNICIAATKPFTNEFVRPLPYLTIKKCKALSLKPGSIVFFDNMAPKPNSFKPHVEDVKTGNLNTNGYCTKEQFHKTLEGSLSKSVRDGFGVDIPQNQKYIPHSTPPESSIVTIKVSPSNFKIVRDDYDKLRAHFTDSDGNKFSFLSITDRRFYDHVVKLFADGKLDEVNNFIGQQDELYLRVGLSRSYTVGERSGYWMQVNGIYTFPNYFEEIDTYE
ncbi:dual OB domain-containing protein [Vibrio parahaemolyticus]